MDADHQRDFAVQRRRVLNVEQIGFIGANARGQVESKPPERIFGNAVLRKTAGNLGFGVRLGKVCKKFILLIEPGKVRQEVTDINFISGEVTAYGVSVNRESHARSTSIASK